MGECIDGGSRTHQNVLGSIPAALEVSDKLIILCAFVNRSVMMEYLVEQKLISEEFMPPTCHCIHQKDRGYI